MMRLIKDEGHGDLHLVEYHEDQIPHYAILSHTWGVDEEEVTYNDFTKDIDKRKADWEKIEFCRQQAAVDDLQHFWIDTCCIDKASSAELTEAVNSMFRWYHDAAKCYVYLSDVPMHEYEENEYISGRPWEATFQGSRWFTRGWTLQELIAPTSVEFFSREGKRLGDKRSLERLVNETTRIAVQALRGSPLSDFSAAERRAWAAERKTTRKEDEAYCLLGIFGVYISTIYGEGHHAFVRLEEAIDKSLKGNFSINRALLPMKRVFLVTLCSVHPPANSSINSSSRFSLSTTFQYKTFGFSAKTTREEVLDRGVQLPSVTLLRRDRLRVPKKSKPKTCPQYLSMDPSESKISRMAKQ